MKLEQTIKGIIIASGVFTGSVEYGRVVAK
jgi:hypothetical protein